MRGLLALLALASCARPRPPDPEAAALARLRAALPNGDLAGATGTATLARAELLAQMARMHDIQLDHGEPTGATAAGWRTLLADIEGHARGAGLARTFRDARTLLGDGRCVRVGPAALPDALAQVAEPRGSWPPFVALEVRAPLVRDAARSRAGVFRCEGGSGPARAVFVPGPGDALVVARIEPAG